MSQSVKLKDGSYIAQSYVGMVIFSTTLDTEEKVKRYYDGEKWEKIEGKFLLGASDSYANGSTGGEATHTLTVDEMPTHQHGIYCGYGEAEGGSSDAFRYQSWAQNDRAWRTRFMQATGSSKAHNNMPPYKAVYIWERTA